MLRSASVSVPGVKLAAADDGMNAYLSCVSCTLAAMGSGRPLWSTSICSPFGAPPPGRTVTLESASLASSRSLVNRPMTLTAASC